jgi:hypothetical protein
MMFVIIFALFLGLSQAWGYTGWQNNIPNGDVYSCENCHVAGSNARNNFGEDYASHNHAWGASLASLDSDDDGYTNGEELQDPDGTWVKGQPQPGDPALVSNPGDATSIPGTEGFSISGTVTGDVLEGVTMTLSGDVSETTMTDSSGNYIFSRVSNGTYEVTPSKSGYFFTPTSRTVTVNGADVTGQNFTSTVISQGYSISGKVSLKLKDGKTPLSGVTLTLSGVETGVALTGADGSYSFSGLSKGTYTITPSKAGYKFTLKKKKVKIKNADKTNVNFKAK